MKIFLLILAGLGLAAQAGHAQQTTAAGIGIIPRPVSVKVAGNSFLIRADTRVYVDDTAAVKVADMLCGMLNVPTGFKLKPLVGRSMGGKNVIVLRLVRGVSDKLGAEDYRLEASAERVVISAGKEAGLFYGMQSLLQLLPPEIESPVKVANVRWELPGVVVSDRPRMGWRGLMLDVSRHFFSKDFLKKYIDEMVRYKFNVFHLHLTDDQGWRLEIRGMPKLTEVGAWRVPRMGSWWSFLPPQPGEAATDGGYYTQKDIRDLVRYAQERFVTIVPEIDVPAHSLALISAYPGLCCTGQQYAVNPGSRFKGECNVLCVANEAVWAALDTIFTQVAALFPGAYIHIGGDEANRSWWGHHQLDKDLMEREKISGLPELQSYFTKRLEKLILSKGKKMMGWDEILEGGIAPEATVMSWRGMQGGIKAAGMGHRVIMTPADYAYLDLYQGDPLVEPETYSMLRLQQCYAFEPVPQGVDPKLILGGQGNLWTESVPGYRQAEYMTWPRACALAEVLWSPGEGKDWKDFTTRLERRFLYFGSGKINYATSLYDAIITGVKRADDSLKVKLATEIDGLDIYYSFDGTNPDVFHQRYAGMPLDIPKGASQIRVRTYRDGRAIGQQINCPLALLKDRIEKN